MDMIPRDRRDPQIYVRHNIVRQAYVADTIAEDQHGCDHSY